MLAAGFGIVLLGLASMSIAAGGKLPAADWIGLYSPVFFIVYLVSMRTVFLFEMRRLAEFVHEKAAAVGHEAISLRTASVSNALNGLLVIGAATYLPHLGDQIATATGLGETFVGTTLIA